MRRIPPIPTEKPMIQGVIGTPGLPIAARMLSYFEEKAATQYEIKITIKINKPMTIHSDPLKLRIMSIPKSMKNVITAVARIIGNFKDNKV